MVLTATRDGAPFPDLTPSTTSVMEAVQQLAAVAERVAEGGDDVREGAWKGKTTCTAYHPSHRDTETHTHACTLQYSH